MQYRRPHPWDGGYAIPDYVMAEPPLRGTFTGRGIDRRTIDAPELPGPWQTGYAYPEYVGQEPIGQGVFRTKYYPRKSIDVLVPEAVGDVEGFAEQDPIANFGEEAAGYIMRTIKALPPGQRKQALRAVFDQLDPKLWSRVAEHAGRISKAGVPDAAALQQAMASAMSMGLLEEFIRVGKTGQIKPKSMSGLAVYGQQAERQMLAGFKSALGMSWGDLNPLNWLAKGTNVVTAKAMPGLTQAGEWGKSVLSTVGDLACSVAKSGAGQIAAGAGASAAGAPPQVGAQGAQMVSAACSGPQPPPVVQSSGSSWILPVAIVGGLGLVAVVLLTRK